MSNERHPYWDPEWRDQVDAWLEKHWRKVVLGLGAAVVAISGGNSRMKKIFVSFAVEDSTAREHLRGQSLNTRTPFEFRDLGLDKPFTERWKTQCREVIRGCDGVIALLSKKTRSADGARWEMKCAVEEDIPILGVHIHRNDKGSIPPELNGNKVIEWTWDGIARFIDGL